MSKKAMLIIFVILYSGVVIVVHQACRYPDFVQSRGGERAWRGHLQQPEAADRPVVYSVSFDGRLMRVVTSNGSVQRRCMLKVGNRTYLAAQRDVVVTSDRAPRYRYLCMEFVRRADAVLQLRTSHLASRMDPHLCAENQLIFDDRPLINRRHRWRSNAVGSGCQLIGGYDVRLYDRRHSRGLCDALDAETRLEAACDGDDNLVHFRFRYDFCVPSELGMRVDQVTHCAATWTTDNDVFTVLVASAADSEDRLDAWCLRRPRWTYGRPFTAFLFRQLICDNRPIAELADALVVDMRPSDDWGASLCEDDYEGCAWDYPAKCARSSDCARTCSVCNDSIPTNCFFGAPLDGRWGSPDGITLLNVDTGSLVVTVLDQSDRVRSTRYECVEWRSDPKSSGVRKLADHSFDEHLVVTRPGAGCRPRYACVQWLYHAAVHDDRSPSVIYFRVSASRPWPIYEPLNCSSFQYTGRQSSADEHVTLLTSLSTNATTRGRDYYISCVTTSLPVGARYVVEFKDEHRRCFAHMESSAEPADDEIYFRLILDGCWEKKAVLNVWCLDRVALSSQGALLLVTEMLPSFPSSDADSVLCWLFTDNDTFYLLSSADCDPVMSMEPLQNGLIRPVAVFVDALSVTSTTIAVTSTTTSVPSPAENNHITENNDISTLYDIVATDAADNATTQAPDSATAATSRGNSSATLNQTRHGSAAQQSSAADDASDDSDVGSPGHSDRSDAEMSSYAHVTDAAAADVIAVDGRILVASVVHVGICLRYREP